MKPDENPADGLRRRQYEAEVRLADRLRTASREERRRLYGEIYDELIRDFPHIESEMRAAGQAQVAWSLGWLKPLLRPGHVFVELGAGNCELTYAASPLVRRAIALEVSDVYAHTSSQTPPANFELRIYDGLELPLEDASVDTVFSTQLMEHLHPEDAAMQLREIRRVLKAGGSYLCLTPHRFSGPHDISLGFAREARGLHLKEYTNRELAQLFRSAGFSRVACLVGGRGKAVKLPAWTVVACERLLGALPHSVRHALASAFPFKNILGICLLGTK